MLAGEDPGAALGFAAGLVVVGDVLGADVGTEAGPVTGDELGFTVPPEFGAAVDV